MNIVDSIDLSSLTPREKIGLMERLWRELSKKPENIEVPAWHLNQLEEAEKNSAGGTDEFIDLERFESELRDRIDQRKTG